MKISVQFEADSAAEYDRILEALSGPGRALFVAAPTVKPIEKTEIVSPAEPAPVEAATPLPDEPAVMPEPAPVEAVVEAPETPVKRRPGRPRMKPIVEEVEAEEPEEKETPKVEEPVVVPPVAAKSQSNGLTHLDVKGAFRDYVIRYGTSNGYSDVPQLLTKAFGSEIRKAEHVPNDQSSLKKAIAIITQALNDNPFNRKVANA